MSSPDPVQHLHSNLNHLLGVLGREMAPDKLEVCSQYTRCLTGIPHPFGNIVIPGQQTEQEFEALLKELEEWIESHGVSVALVLVPSVGLPSRGNFAESRQWIRLDDMPGMWMELSTGFEVGLLSPGVSVNRADTAEDLQAVTDLVAEGYPIHPEAADFFMRGIQLAGEASEGRFANVIARVEAEPAACASVCVHENVAGIYCVATLERFRGRGLGTAVTRAAMLEGHRHGATHALLHASEMGTPVYAKIGFEEHCRVPVYGFGPVG